MLWWSKGKASPVVSQVFFWLGGGVVDAGKWRVTTRLTQEQVSYTIPA